MKKFDFVVLLLLYTMLCSCGIKKPLEPPVNVIPAKAGIQEKAG